MNSNHLIDQASIASTGSMASVLGRIDNPKHFTDSERLEDVFSQYSTLEISHSNNGAAGIMDDEEFVKKYVKGLKIKQNDGSRENNYKRTGNHSLNSQEAPELKFFQIAWNWLIAKSYKINHCILNYQAVTPPIYQALLFIEFLQMMFFVFHNVEIVNEYSIGEFQHFNNNNITATLNQTIDNLFPESGLSVIGNILTPQQDLNSSINNNSTITNTFIPSQGAVLQPSKINQVFRLDTQYLIFANLQLLPLNNYYITSTSHDLFIIVFGSINGIFVTLFLLMYTMGEGLFKQVKHAQNHQIQEGTLLVMKTFSIFFTLFLGVMHMPMLTINLQSYLCEENSSGSFALVGVQCFGNYHQIMILLSTVILVCYQWFLVIEVILYTTCNYKIDMPWSSLDRELAHIKVIWKHIIAAGFVFDKNGLYRAEIGFICAIFGALICYRRLKSAIIYNQEVYYVLQFQELIITCLFLSVSFLNAIQIEYTISLIIMVLVLCVVVVLMIMYLNKILGWRDLLKSAEQTEGKFAISNMHSQRLLYRMLTLMQSTEPSDVITVHGIIANHIDECKNQECPCREIVKAFEERNYRTIIIKDMVKQQTNQFESNIKAVFKQNTIAGNIALPHHSGSIQSNKSKQNLSKVSTFAGNKSTIQLKSNGNSCQLDSERFSNEVFPAAPASGTYLLPNRQGINQERIGVQKDLFMHDDIEDNCIPENNFTSNFEQSLKGCLNETSIQNFQKIESKVNEKQEKIENYRLPHSESQENFIQRTQAKIALLTNPLFQRRKRLSQKSSLPFNESIHAKGAIIQPQQSFNNEKNSCSDTQNDAENEEIKKLAQTNEKEESESVLREEQMKMKYKFVALYLEKMINIFPKSAQLRIHNSFIQSTYIKNEFKANFELMQTELCPTTIQNRFFIFRRRIDIDNLLRNKNIVTMKLGNKIDPLNVYNHEKELQRFTRLSYFAANSALTFWRELMQKYSIDAEILKAKGVEIFKNYEGIQYLADEILRLFPNDICFMLKYALFLKHIMNNEQESLVFQQRATHTYQRTIQIKRNGLSDTDQGDEISIFGENTASAVIIVSLTAAKVGTIMHTNDEVKRALNYERKELIGKKVNCIQPQIIARVHDDMLRKFTETAKRNVIDTTKQMVALSKEGYFRPVNSIIKLYPHMTEKIVVIGFLQRILKYKDMEPSKISGVQNEQLANFAHHYILTDTQGYIQCVSEGMSREIGLNPKFFISTDNFQSQVSIEKLIINDSFNQSRLNCEIVKDDELDFANDSDRQQIYREGVEVTINTFDILSKVNVEMLSTEEIQEVSKVEGCYKAHIQLKRFSYFNDQCVMDCYRVILLPDNIEGHNDSSKITKIIKKEGSESNISEIRPSANVFSKFISENHKTHQSANIAPHNSQSMSDYPDQMSQSASSCMSDDTSQSVNQMYSKMIQEFKLSISKRNTPKHLIKLGRILMFVLVITIIISSVDYLIKISYLDNSQNYFNGLIQGQVRNIQMIALVQNIRSFVNLANGIEFEEYSKEQLKGINRFNYLKDQIQIQATLLQETNDLLSMSRHNLSSIANVQEFDVHHLTLFRLAKHQNEEASTIQSFQLPYIIALNTYLNNILTLNVTSPNSLLMNDQLLKGAPQLSLLANIPDQRQTDLYFIIANGLRSLRQQTQYAMNQQKTQLIEHTQNEKMIEALLIMIIGVIVSSISLILIINEIVQGDKNQRRIMSIFALISREEVKKVYDICDQYIDRFENGGVLVIQNQQQNQDERGHLDEYNTQDRKSYVDYQKNGKLNDIFGIDTQNFKTSEYRNNDLSHSENTNLVHQNLHPFRHYNFSGNSNKYYSKLIDNAQILLKDQQQTPLISQEKPNKTEIPLKVYDKKRLFKRKSGVLNISQLPKQVMANINKTAKLAPMKLKPQIAQNNNVQCIEDKIMDDESDEEENSEQFQNIKTKVQIQPLKTEMTNEQKQIRHRKKLFGSSAKNNQALLCKSMFLVNLIVLLIFQGYFFFTYFYHKGQLDVVAEINENSPVFFERYQNMFLQYAFLREKLINNNANFSQMLLNPPNGTKQIPSYTPIGSNNFLIDDYYHQMSMDVESRIQNIKLNKRSALSTLIDFSNNIDSPLFCSHIFDLKQQANNSQQSTVFQTEQLKSKIAEASIEIDRTIKLIRAARTGDIQKLIGLNELIKNYDGRTLLHEAARDGQKAVIDTLFSEKGAIWINAKDRWGVTPIGDAWNYPQILDLMKSKGAINGTLPMKKEGAHLNDEQYRIFYASYNKNLVLIQDLITFGINVNIQDENGRTPLSVAASEGSLEVVKFLILIGANISIKDSRGNDPLADATREKRQAVADYLKSQISVIIIRDQCPNFEDGLFSKGLASAFGIFNRKYADIQIAASKLKYNDAQLRSLLGGRKYQNQSNILENEIIGTSTARAIEVVQSTTELYLFKVIQKQISVLTLTYDNYRSSYKRILQIVFLIFISFQVLTLFYLRTKLVKSFREEIMQSRGILNLVPERFFRDHQKDVEKIIQIMNN